MIELRSRSVHDTRAIAAAVAHLARAGDLIVLAGQMGAGKTAFAIYTMTASNIKGHTNHVADFNLRYGFTYFHYFAKIFVSKDFAFFHISSSFIHVQIGSTNICSCNFN